MKPIRIPTLLFLGFLAVATFGLYAARVSATRRTAADVHRLRADLDKKEGQSIYLVIDTIHNTLQVRQADRILHQAICATGSGGILRGSGGRSWTFLTPRGLRLIRGKVVNPVWIKPVWAFVEEGLPVPPPSDSTRYDVAALGDYALDMGQGYLIHGTLYPNLIGFPVTHGCIRLDDADLERVYALAPVGTRVYIY